MIDLQNEMFVTPGMVCATVSAIYFTDTAVVCPSCMSQTDHQIITSSRLISVVLRIYNSQYSVNPPNNDYCGVISDTT